MTVTINGTTGIAGVDGSAATPAVQGGVLRVSLKHRYQEHRSNGYNISKKHVIYL